MKCPDCDVEMTCHAKKVIYPRSEDEASLVDEALGGVLLERHTCPGCGKGASRVHEPSRPEPERRASEASPGARAPGMGPRRTD